jgi:hypothetical protein
MPTCVKSSYRPTGLRQVFWAAASVSCDVVIAIGMTYHASTVFALVLANDANGLHGLSMQLLRRDTRWQDTHRLLVGLMRLALETGVVTSEQVTFTQHITLSTSFDHPAIFVIAFIIMNIMVTGSSDQPLRYCATPFVLLFDKLYANMMMLTLNHRMMAFNKRATIHTAPPPDIMIGRSHLSNLSGPPNIANKSDMESQAPHWDRTTRNSFMIAVCLVSV